MKNKNADYTTAPLDADTLNTAAPFALRETIAPKRPSTKTLPTDASDDDTARNREIIDADDGTTIDSKDLSHKAKILNLLDHGGVITKKQGIAGFGSGLVSLIQSLLLSSLFGYLLAASGLFAGAKTLISSFMGEMQPATDPLMEHLDEFFEEAEKRGVGREELIARLKKKTITHSLTTRVQKYAVISLFGRGGGSMWLTGISGVIALSSVGHLPGMITAGSNALFMGKQALDIVKDEIISYRFMHHPEILQSRVEMLVDYHTDNTKKAEKRLMHEVARELVTDREKIGGAAVEGFMNVIMKTLDGRDADKQKVNILFSTLADILEAPPPVKPEPTRQAEDMMKRFARNVFKEQQAKLAF